MKTTCLRLAVLAALADLSHGAHAQTTAADKESLEIPTVTVTAQRRREPAREVPLTTEVLNGEAMERAGYKSLSDLAALLPGVNYDQAGGGTGQSQITMRGISTGSQVGATVGMYIDDIPFGSSSAYAGGGSSSLDLGLFDLAAVEVLRGPQGTLYGAGAMGGLIKYSAVEPNLDAFSTQGTAELSATRGGGLNHVLRAVVNAPLDGGRTALRATLYKRSEDGFIRDHLQQGRLVDGSTTSGGRIALLFAPSKDLSARLTVLSQRQQRDGSSTEDDSVVSGQPVYGSLSKRLFVNEPFHIKNDLISLAIKADFNWATFDAITGWQRSSNSGRSDPSALYASPLPMVGPDAAGYAFDYAFYNRKVTQEFRLTSPRSRVFEWLGGVFYTNEAGTKSQTLQPLNAGRQPVAPLLISAEFPSAFRESAVFGNGTYYLNEKTDVTLGVRRSHNTQGLDQTMAGIFAPPPLPDAHSSEDVTNWLLTARWRPAERQALYVRAASGYRPGGPLPVIINPFTGQPLNKPSFLSDRLWSYELGWKGDLLPRVLTSELALYQIDWKDMQLFTSKAGFSGIANAGRARSRGIEWTVRAMPKTGWRLASALSVIDATLRDDSPDLGGKKGDRLPDTARLSIAAQADHDFQLYGWPAYAGATLRYTGDRINAFNASAIPQFHMPAYSTLDARAGIEYGHISVGLIARNLTNKRGQTSADTAFSAAGGPARVSLASPRTIGIQVNAAF
jgi:outer membrane receptor protein involved in Fe transport